MSTPGATADSRFEDRAATPIQVQIVRVPDCPLVERLRAFLDRCLSRTGMTAIVEEIEGPYPSPTLLINGADVTGRPRGFEASCRLDLPTQHQILAALTQAVANPALPDRR
ncbi:MAG: alkylmercury lyase [Actinomycetota bacterium]